MRKLRGRGWDNVKQVRLLFSFPFGFISFFLSYSYDWHQHDVSLEWNLLFRSLNSSFKRPTLIALPIHYGAMDCCGPSHTFRFVFLPFSLYSIVHFPIEYLDKCNKNSWHQNSIEDFMWWEINRVDAMPAKSTSSIPTETRDRPTNITIWC